MMEWLGHYGGMVVMFVFMGVFFGFGFWAFRPANREKMRAYGEIPLKESRDGNE